MFDLVKYDNKKDNRFKAVPPVTWEHFCNRMEKHDIRRQKDGPAFSAVRYAESIEGFEFKQHLVFHNKHPKAGQKKGMVYENGSGEQRITDMEGLTTRANCNVLAVSMIVMDFDQGTIDEVSKKLEGLNYCIYTTFSNTKEQEKFRVIVPLKSPIPTSRYLDVWTQLFKLTGEVADPSCKDPARLNFMPSCPPETASLRRTVFETDKKPFAPKLNKKSVEKKTKKKSNRGDYRTLDAVRWFVAHNSYQGETGKPNQHWVDCPWKSEHTGGIQGETDTVLYTDNTDNWPTFKCSHAHCSNRDIQDVIKLWGDADDYCSKEAKPSDIKTHVLIRALGHDDQGRYYYQCNTNNQIVALKASEHKELNFYGITADIDYWWKHFGSEESGKINWRNAAISMMLRCQDIGFFRPDSVRGGGVWDDEGRVVVHLGRRLLVDTVDTPITSMKSEHIYEAMVKNIDLPEPLDNKQSSQLFDIINQLPIVNEAQRWLFAGSIVAGMLSGVLRWRPHIWLTGDAGSGKTSILRNVLAPMWSAMGGVYCEGKTTEAGIRQQVRHSAVPVIIDESEANQKDEAIRVASLIGLARSSSSDSTANVYKGTTGGSGLSFTVRSCFAFCSVSHALEWAQDKERFSIIQVQSSKESINNWPKLRKHIKATLTKEFALGLYCRAQNNLELIHDTTDTLHRIIAEVYPDSEPRWRDQVGILLACAYSILSEEQIPEGFAAKMVESVGKMENREKGETDSSLNAIKTLLSHLIHEHGGKKSLGELVLDAKDDFSKATVDKKDQASLHRYGLAYDADNDYLYIAGDHTQTKTIFSYYGITGHHGLIGLYKGAEKVDSYTFGAIKCKAIRVKLEEIM